MRLAILSDIHGNLVALEAVLADLQDRAPDRIINLGDSVTSPLWPRETFERLEQLALPTVRGNHDRWLLEGVRKEMTKSVAFTYEALTPSQRTALGTLPAAASFAAIELPTEKAALIALGEQHRTAWDLYKAFEAQANGGQRLNPARLPDWTGIYSRSGVLFNWDQDQGRNRMPTAKLTPEYLIVQGEPVETILRVATENQASLIVLGTHGRTGLTRLLLGSVAEQVLRQATCPVLISRMPA